MDYQIAKADTALGVVYGFASVAGIVDTQDDVIEPAVLEKAVVEFMQDHRAAGEMHNGQPKTGTVVESVVMSPEKATAMGLPAEVAKAMPTAWWIGVKADPATLAKVKDGSYRMFSIEGTGTRVAA